jgi:hypothetical protein
MHTIIQNTRRFVSQRKFLTFIHAQEYFNEQIRTGLVFFGTPHDGGDKTLVALGSAAARVAVKLHVQSSSDIIETLKIGSLFSDILQEHWRQQLLSYQIISFWEGIGDVCKAAPSLPPPLQRKLR